MPFFHPRRAFVCNSTEISLLHTKARKLTFCTRFKGTRDSSSHKHNYCGIDSRISGEECVGEPARVSPALRDGFPPQLIYIGYGDFKTYLHILSFWN